MTTDFQNFNQPRSMCSAVLQLSGLAAMTAIAFVAFICVAATQETTPENAEEVRERIATHEEVQASGREFDAWWERTLKSFRSK